MKGRNEIIHTGAGTAILRVWRKDGTSADVKIDARDILAVRAHRWHIHRENEVVARSIVGEGLYLRLGAHLLQTGGKMAWRVKCALDYRRRNLSRIQIKPSEGSVFFSKAHNGWFAKLSRRGVVVTRLFSVGSYGRHAETFARAALSRMLGLRQGDFESLRFAPGFRMRAFARLWKERTGMLFVAGTAKIREMILDARVSVHEWLRSQLAADDTYGGNAEYAGCAVDRFDGSFAIFGGNE